MPGGDRATDDGDRLTTAALVETKDLEAIGDHQGPPRLADRRRGAIEGKQCRSSLETTSVGGGQPKRPGGPGIGRHASEAEQRFVVVPDRKHDPGAEVRMDASTTGPRR